MNEELEKRLDKFKYVDVIDAACQFSDQLELSVNKPDIGFLQLRMQFLEEEFHELDSALFHHDDVEAIDGAMDVAFIAITQAYHVFRKRGFGHVDAVVRTRLAFIRVCETNIVKNPPVRAGEKITKPEGWEAPKIKELLERGNA